MKPPITTTQAGQVQGAWQEKGQIAVFKGIPFAKPPVGDLRWRAPQAVAAWTGIKKTTAFSPSAWQQGAAIHTFFNALMEGQGWGKLRTFSMKALFKVVPQPKQNEDCLYLNIRTPQLDTSAKLPVMVWIHGGDHQDGSAGEPYYDGNGLPQKGVVTVTINYRLGLMGYFTHPELTQASEKNVCGNYGTLDQIAALQWVQDNIAAFGGDADNVTIFGESAGGESVAHMLSSPLAKGLFHKAIMQSPANSGQMIHLFKPFLDHLSGEDMGARFAKQFGIEGANQVEQLRKLPAEDLQKFVKDNPDICGFFPAIDGYVLPKSPFETFFDGEQAKVPVLLGSNANEGSIIHPLFTAPLVEFRFREMPANQQPKIFFEEYSEEADQLFILYPGLEKRTPTAESDFLGDGMFGSKVRFYAEQIAKTEQPAYFYFFTRVPPSPTQTAGAFHAAELPFVHGTSTPILPLNEADKQLSNKMMDYWTQFAKTGNPNGQGHPQWDPFNAAQARWMLLGTDKVGMSEIEREEKYRLINERTLRHIQAMKGLRVESSGQYVDS